MRQALKEWAIVCRWLAEGRQTLLLRKGGTAEPGGEFSVPWQRFWLFPTWLHQQEQGVTAAAWPVLVDLNRHRPPDGSIRISHWAEVVELRSLDSEEQALRLAGLHCWTEETVRQRFHYRRPGLLLLVLRVYAVPEPFLLPEAPRYAGCRSWVELEQDLTCEGSFPVLGEEEFVRCRRQIAAAVQGEEEHAP
jgi:hypothetical protein